MNTDLDHLPLGLLAVAITVGCGGDDLSNDATGISVDEQTTTSADTSWRPVDDDSDGSDGPAAGTSSGGDDTSSEGDDGTDASGSDTGDSPRACGGPFEGYGAMTVGGEGGDEYRVTSLSDSGAGTLRDGIEQADGPRTIVFDVEGTIVLEAPLIIASPYLTVDGCSAPDPGVTVTHDSPDEPIIAIQGTHDVVLRGFRVAGLWSPGSGTSEGGDKLIVNGDSGPDFEAANLVFDHLTISGGGDAALDLWGEVHDVTVSWSLLHDSARGGIVSHYPAPFQVRQRITYSHNVYSRNIERNPQIRADVRELDYVNNIVHDWGVHDPASGYGIRIRNDGDEPPVQANFIRNVFASSVNPSLAFIDAGSGSQLWLEGNVFPPEFVGDPTTLPGPIPTPDWAQVEVAAAAELSGVVLPDVGAPYRTPSEQDLLDEIAADL